MGLLDVMLMYGMRISKLSKFIAVKINYIKFDVIYRCKDIYIAVKIKIYIGVKIDNK